VTNQLVNFGQEYVWHCHLLGHEENDMRRPIIVAAAPDAPANLVATTLSSPLRVQLTWTNPGAAADGFTIQRATNAGFTTGLTSFNVVGSILTYTDSTVAANTSYYYRVMSSTVYGDTAVYAAPAAGYPNQRVNSAPSNVVLAGLPAAPSNLQFSQANHLSPVVLTWRDNAPSVVNPPNANAERFFIVQRATNLNGPWTTMSSTAAPVAGSGGTGTFSDTKISTTAGITYYYRVQATNYFGNSAVTTPVTVVLK
jgi:hypothetical protein